MISTQRGIATLTITVMLLMLLGIGALTISKMSVMEQRIVSNELRAQEAHEAAKAGLEWVAAYLSITPIPETLWASGATQTYTGSGVIPPVLTYSTGDFATTVVLTRQASYPDFIRVIATATSAATSVDSTAITASVSGTLTTRPATPPGQTAAPPILLSGCITTPPTGTPDVYSNGGIAVATLSSADTATCLPTGHLQSQPAGVDVPLSEKMNNYPTPADDGSGDPMVWQTTMNLTVAEFAAMAQTDSNAGPGYRYYYLNGSSNIPGGTYGSPTSPVVIAFHDGCQAKPNGNATIYGYVIFLEENSCTGSSDLNGWGNVALFGSLIVNGNAEKPNANTGFHVWGSVSGGGGNGLPAFPPGLIPGTWKDF